ncbi:hypothetical protein GCM10022254_38900 [Actinomadura meridiana]|uniref:Uncharacterized protein n=1 Tax=Actinomadura meridiana TaxID=559626 RepID=A0ABP8C6S5_9ACTN
MEQNRPPREFREPHDSPETAAVPFDPPPSTPRSPIEKAITRHRNALLKLDGVQGIDHSHAPDGSDVIRVHVTTEAARPNVPTELDGFPVIPLITGPYEAH